MKHFENLFRGAIAALLLALPLGCGREAAVVTAPAPVGPPVTQIDLSVLPPEFAAAAREILTEPATEPGLPLTDAEARLLLGDNDLARRVGNLTDRATYLVLNVLKAVWQESGVLSTHGRLRLDSDRVSFHLDPFEPATAPLVVRVEGGSTYQVEVVSIDREWFFEWATAPFNMGQLWGKRAGRLVARVVVPGRLDLRIDACYAPSPRGDNQPQLYRRRLSGWVISAAEGRWDINAQSEGEASEHLHGGYVSETVTACLRNGAHRVLLCEKLDDSGYIDPMTSISYITETQRGVRFVRLGARLLALPAVERRRYFYSKYFYRVMRSAEWRMVGEFMAAGSPVAHYEFDAPPADEMAAGPGVRLAREGGTPAPAPVLNPGAYDRLEGPPMLIFPGIYTGW